MERKIVSGIMLTLLLISMLTLAFNIQLVKASGTIYIRADGSVEPDTAPISSVDNVTYTFTGNVYDSIVVERDNIVVDGVGYMLQGTGAYASRGFDISGRSNITIKNTHIINFYHGIYLDLSSKNIISGNNITANNWGGIWLYNSSNNSIIGNNIANNDVGITLYYYSNNNSIAGNTIIANNWGGIILSYSSNNNSIVGNTFINGGLYVSESCKNQVQDNSVNGKPLVYLEGVSDYAVENAGQVILVNCSSIRVENLDLSNAKVGVELLGTNGAKIVRNNITANRYVGIWLEDSSNNCIVGNNIANNGVGIWLYRSSNNNRIFHNNFTYNAHQARIDYSVNVWDDGYPSGGNYWSDYTGIDLSPHDGIGDRPYVIDANNRDRYPLINPWTPTSPVPMLPIPSRIKVLTDPSKPPVEMDIEEYLRGVIHVEMNPQVFMPLLGLNEEQMLIALKAQAIASRTYAVARVLGIMWNPHHGTGADVCTHHDCCQEWSDATDALSDKAVSDTRNVVITYQGSVIQAFFFGHCDGHTRNCEDVFVKPLPYCRSVLCGCGQTSMLGHGVGMCQYGAMMMAKQGYNYQSILKHYYTGVEVSLANPTGAFNVAKLGCPGELRVHDSENRTTGVLNGEIKNEIPYSSYDEANKAVIVVFPNDSYRYMIKGTSEGLYNLTIANVTQSQTTTFVAIDIPISYNATDLYTIDWAILSQGGEGVTVHVDSDGDGVIEYTFTSDNELTHDEFMLQTATILGDINGDGIVDIVDIVICALAFGSRPGHTRWNPQADLNNDGLIDIFDLVTIAIHYGEHV